MVPMAIAGLLGVSMPVPAAVLFDPLPPGEESTGPITPPPPAKPLTGTEWRAQDPRRSTSLLPVELRPKQRILCAEALSDERLQDPVETMSKNGTPYFSELFRISIENSVCREYQITKYMRTIASKSEIATNINGYRIYYYEIDAGFFVSPLFWIPEYFASVRFDADGTPVASVFSVNK
jgi:hypothetical protein